MTWIHTHAGHLVNINHAKLIFIVEQPALKGFAIRAEMVDTAYTLDLLPSHEEAEQRLHTIISVLAGRRTDDGIIHDKVIFKRYNS